MTTMLIANNCTRESGSFMGDQLCLLKTCYLFVENTPGVDHVIMSMSPGNEMAFLWTKFIEKYNIELIYDDFNPGNWTERFNAWNRWRAERKINGIKFDIFKECHLRIHGHQRQQMMCGSERGLGHNIYEYWWRGQENSPEEMPKDVEPWDNHGVTTSYRFGDDLIHHPPHTPQRDIYISPHAKTQGNATFSFEFWGQVVRQLIDAGVSVTVGYDGYFCEELNNHPLYKKFWGGLGEAGHKLWMEEVCRHKLVACGNTGTGWLAAACGVPMITMEPPNSVMADHRYRECGLANIVEVVDTPNAEYVARRITEEVRRCVVMTTGCYDILHAGHVRHLERSRALGTRLVVALNSDVSIKRLKGEGRPINPENQRKAVLEALRCVDEVRLFDGPNALPLIRELKPNILTNGFGYEEEDIVGRDEIKQWGGRAVVTCRGDAKDEPSTTNVIKRVRAADVIEVCRVGASSSVNPFEKLKLIADHLLSVKDLPGDIADLGTCRGGTGYVMRRLAPDKHLHLFDTWEGTPYDDPLCHHKKGEWAASLEECQRLVGNGELTHYHQGVFPDWDGDDCHGNDYRPAREQQFCFVYVDMDTEQATHDAIKFFWPLMVPGGKIMIDDWLWSACRGVEIAVREFFTDEQIQSVANLYTVIIEKR